ncbi:hypothetical protein Arcpr_0971 [Archaeoglobus profundus DSM 5631]|uniref:Uncharacterized protein n=1 Tax=Archaeoglobus profundus (strain DSM 5631 / JCM 9629 / NBRC 100127 / Av18) TaxID=572546 RepID=D2RIA7_ARCPA|nr:hypothetical protein Arcpr_0971 [Archaeoglobus profundus DSM 5631]
MKYRIKVLGKEYEVEVDEVYKNVFEVVVNGKRAIIKLE